ncbi:MAG: MFS transporter [Chloroflexota bacterium]
MRHRFSTVFYGWWIAAASFAIALYVGSVVFYGFTAFFEPIAEEMGWSYAQVSLGSSLRGLEAGILAPFVGLLVDRFGPRKLVFIGGILAAGGLGLLSQTTSLGMFYASFALMALGTSCCAGIVLMTAVANWFQRRIGIATGIAICGFGFSGLLVPLIVKLIGMYEWRTAIAILAVGMVAMVLPLSLVFRHKPEVYGYFPDGDTEDSVSPVGSLEQPEAIEIDLRAVQALKTGIFWRIVAISTCHMIVMQAVVIHVMPYLSSIGVARATSGFVAAAIPVCSIAGRLGLGWLGDRYGRRLVIAGAFGMMAVGVFCFASASIAGFLLVIPFLALFGIGYGGSNAMRIALARQYFGRTRFGSIFGLAMGISILGGIMAPPLAGWVYDSWGSYQGVWFAFAALPVVAGVLALSLPRAEEEDRR